MLCFSILRGKKISLQEIVGGTIFFFMLHFFHVALFSCCTFFILYHFHAAFFCVVIFSRCTFFRVALLLGIALFHVALLHVARFSFYILLLLHSSHVAFFSCCTLFQGCNQEPHKHLRLRALQQ